MKTFPTVLWGDTRATFLPSGADLPAAPLTAALVFAMQDNEFVLADIAGRGWCIPGGRLETGESVEQAARRESHEEIGAALGPLSLLGHYVLTPVSAAASGPVSDSIADTISDAGSDAISNAMARGVENEAQPVLVPHTHHASPDTRLVATYLADVIALAPLPSGTESWGVRRVRYEELRACYYAWDALLEAMFAYAWAHHNAAL